MSRVERPEQPEHPVIKSCPPKEALRRARPLPKPEDLAIEGLTDEEWEAFQKALAEL